MKLKELYEKGLDRKLNPAVSASDLTDETVLTEITEYVFTQEIIVNLYNILTNIKVNQGSHVGIWINGYFGSGKSHFLKYASYCLSASRDRRDLAFEGLIVATRRFHAPGVNCDVLDQAGVSESELKALQKWYVDKATAEMVMFNIGDVHNVNSDQKTAFTTIFWNQFNAHRGYNSFNLALAQHLEKTLDEDGKFDAFKALVHERGYDWEQHISRFAAGKLDLALQMAMEVDADIATDVIRQRVKDGDVNVSVEAFVHEMKEYLDKRGDKNCRVLFFVDEVSQFVGAHSDLLLQLQSLVKRLDEECNSQVWVACTAQESLEEVVANVGGKANDPNDQIGKILGRFEVRASLQGTSPEYITQKRVLDKTGQAEHTLVNLYQKERPKLEAQFVLPTTYRTYKDKDDFAACYPFVPYQFQLIMRVLDSFEQQGYVNKEVKGNERSLLNITYAITKETKEQEVGDFVPFDSFFGAMLQGSMQHLGQQAIKGAREALAQISDKAKQDFYRRVVNVLFMICNLSEVDRQGFSATIDNIVTLLMTRIDANKATMKNEVSEALAYLMDKSVIHTVTTASGSEVYDFYTEEESRVAQIIKSQTVDQNTYAEELYKVIYSHFGFSASSNKETFCSRSFNVGANVESRHYLSNNADVEVDFVFGGQVDNADQYAFTNQPSHLAFFLYSAYNEENQLRRDFVYYCRVQRFASEPALSEERQRTRKVFLDRAAELYKTKIVPGFQKILDTCPVISGQQVLPASAMGTLRQRERYKTALVKHLESLYYNARLVAGEDTPKTQSELQEKIRMPLPPTLPGTYTPTEAGKKVADWLQRQPHDTTMTDVARQFAKPPYGWSDFASIYVVNELVRHHIYDFKYKGTPHVSREDVANRIVREMASFTIVPAELIPQEVINNFVEAWKKIFNVTSVPGTGDSTELYRQCKEEPNSALNRLLNNYRGLAQTIAAYPFAGAISEAISLLESWLTERDHQRFFETVTGAQSKATPLFDNCKRIKGFVDDHAGRYLDVRQFVDDNRDNFTLLPDNAQENVTSLRRIMDDKEPWETLQAYIKIKRSLERELAAKRTILTDKIREAYNNVFDELDKYAQSVGVAAEKYARRDITISTLCAPSNLYALQAATNTSSFFSEQMGLINAAIETDGGGGAPRRRKVVRLNTRSSHPMHTEEDIDRYLKGLKDQLMSQLAGDTDIIVG